jgi:hypothetical protein
MFVQVVGDAKSESVIVEESSKSFIGIKIVPCKFVELYSTTCNI